MVVVEDGVSTLGAKIDLKCLYNYLIEKKT